MTLTAIIFAGILTYFTRMTMIALISRDMLGDKIKAVLEYVPSAVFPCLLYTSPSPRDVKRSRMPSSA